MINAREQRRYFSQMQNMRIATLVLAPCLVVIHVREETSGEVLDSNLEFKGDENHHFSFLSRSTMFSVGEVLSPTMPHVPDGVGRPEAKYKMPHRPRRVLAGHIKPNKTRAASRPRRCWPAIISPSKKPSPR